MSDGRRYSEFLDDELTRLAIERKFEILGEASRRLRDYDPDTAARLRGINEAIATRNVIVHQYDGIDCEKIGEAIQDHLPGMRDTARQLLEEYGPPERRE